MDLELFVDVFQVERHRTCRDSEFVGGGFVVMPVDEHLQNPSFLLGKSVIGIRRRSDLSKQADDAAGDVRRHRSAAVHSLFELGDDLGGRCFIEKLAAGYGAKCLEYLVVIAVDRKNYDR